MNIHFLFGDKNPFVYGQEALNWKYFIKTYYSTLFDIFCKSLPMWKDFFFLSLVGTMY